MDITKPEWKIRRRLIYLTLLFCASCITWILISSDTRPVIEMVAMSAFGLGGTTLASYIFGAVWDDNNFMNNKKD